ncbi:MAG: polysaccharide pyruvyl transferase family protein [Lachnospiraceae bacterium]
MKIGLFGFTLGHENLGCQALTCSFLELLEKNITIDHVEVVFFTNEKTMGTIPGLFPQIVFKKVGVSLRRYPPVFLKEVEKCDILFDVTYGDGFSDIYFVKSVYRDALIKFLLGKKEVPFVLLPQTYGPFKRKSLEWLAGRAIHAADYVYARDHISADYATRIAGRDVRTVTDMAFALSFKVNRHINAKEQLGVNVSGLLWKGGFSSSNQFGMKTNYQLYCIKLVEKALEENFEVHIIPHVTKSSDPNRKIPDGDYMACEELAKQFECESVYLAPCFESPYEVKNYIAGMDFFIGARMHATIGAFSAGVATIPFSYSRKFQGLYDNLEYPFYVDGTTLHTDEALSLTLEYIHRDNELKNAANIAMSQVMKNLKGFERELQKILDQR